MKSFSIFFSYLWYLCLLNGCNQSNAPEKRSKRVAQGEFIYRTHTDFFYQPPAASWQPSPNYSWQKHPPQSLDLINKYHFRCRGSAENLPRAVENGGQKHYLLDCHGPSSHSLPIKEGKEFIYPILITLLNHLQKTFQKRIIITSGHRCPDHHQYIDVEEADPYSKHMIGAEVSFYIDGLEGNPESVIRAIQNYYQETPDYQGETQYTQFLRWEKGSGKLATLPWYNKEIFIKLYLPHEGRNHDNAHHLSYFSLQVRYDREAKAPVSYSWEKAFHSYFRH